MWGVEKKGNYFINFCSDVPSLQNKFPFRLCVWVYCNNNTDRVFGKHSYKSDACSGRICFVWNEFSSFYCFLVAYRLTISYKYIRQNIYLNNNSLPYMGVHNYYTANCYTENISIISITSRGAI